MAEQDSGLAFMPPPNASRNRREKMLSLLRWLNVPIVALAILSFIVEYGLVISEATKKVVWLIAGLIAVYFVLELGITLLFSPDRKQNLKSNWLPILISALFMLTGFVVPFTLHGSFVTEKAHYTALIEIFVFLMCALKIFKTHKDISLLNIKPAQMFVLSFALIILAGAVLLSLPKASAPGKPISTIDALFTATSATCVTGLSTFNIGSGLSNLGHFITLFLIQIGGLGIMTFAAFFSLALGKSISIKERVVMKDLLNYETLGEIGKIVIYILLITFVIEFVGAIFLLDVWPESAAPTALAKIKFSVFHSISAFCNAGFTLFDNNLENYPGHLKVNFVITLLIIAGGLGFTVLFNLVTFRVSTLRFLQKFRFFQKYTRHTTPSRLTLQTKIVLITSLALILLGTVFLLLFEYKNPETIANRGFGEKTLVSYFHSVTSRTAGFDTVGTGLFTNPSLLLMMFLMFIGASPGSTGGGIKTCTFVILLMTIRSFCLGKNNVEMYKRTLPKRLIESAIVIFAMSILLIFTFSLILTILEPAIPFERLLFEVISAFGTVGLSTGITASLSTASKIVIIITMFIGRVGPLTLMLAMAQEETQTAYEYPNENVMVG